MRLQFTYEIGDLKETLTPVITADRRRARMQRRILTVYIYTFSAVCFGAMFWLRSLRPEPLWELDGTPIDFVSDVLPGWLCAAYMCVIFCSVLTKSLRSPKPSSTTIPPTRTVSARVIGAAFGLLVAALVLLFLDQAYVMPISPTRTQRILLSGGPWALTIILMIVSGSVRRRRSATIQWEKNPSWIRPKTMEIDACGYRVSDELAQLHYTWRYFISARETENLLILKAEDSRQHIIPKRAFSDPAQIQQCRAMLQTFIGKTEFMVVPTGFEVIPKPVLPLPPLPQTSSQPATTQAGKDPVVSAATEEVTA